MVRRRDASQTERLRDWIAQDHPRVIRFPDAREHAYGKTADVVRALHELEEEGLIVHNGRTWETR